MVKQVRWEVLSLQSKDATILICKPQTQPPRKGAKPILILVRALGHPSPVHRALSGLPNEGRHNHGDRAQTRGSGGTLFRVPPESPLPWWGGTLPHSIPHPSLDSHGPSQPKTFFLSRFRFPLDEIRKSTCEVCVFPDNEMCTATSSFINEGRLAQYK